MNPYNFQRGPQSQQGFPGQSQRFNQPQFPQPNQNQFRQQPQVYGQQGYPSQNFGPNQYDPRMQGNSTGFGGQFQSQGHMNRQGNPQNQVPQGFPRQGHNGGPNQSQKMNLGYQQGYGYLHSQTQPQPFQQPPQPQKQARTNNLGGKPNQQFFDPFQQNQNQNMNFNSNPSFQRPQQRTPPRFEDAMAEHDGFEMVAFDPSNQANPADFFFNPMAMMEQIAQQIMGQFGGQMTGEEGEPMMMGGMIMMEPMIMMEGPDGMMMMGGGGFPGGMMMMGGGPAMLTGGNFEEQFISQGGFGGPNARHEQFVSRSYGGLNERGEFVSEQQNEYANNQGIKKQEIRQVVGDKERKIYKEKNPNNEEVKEVEFVNIEEGEEKQFEEKFNQSKSNFTGIPPKSFNPQQIQNGNQIRQEPVRFVHHSNVTGVGSSPGAGSSLEELKSWYKEKYGREL